MSDLFFYNRPLQLSIIQANVLLSVSSSQLNVISFTCCCARFGPSESNQVRGEKCVCEKVNYIDSIEWCSFASSTYFQRNTHTMWRPSSIATTKPLTAYWFCWKQIYWRARISVTAFIVIIGQLNNDIWTWQYSWLANESNSIWNLLVNIQWRCRCD